MKLSKVILGISLASGMGLATQVQAFSIGTLEVDRWDNLNGTLSALDSGSINSGNGVIENRLVNPPGNPASEVNSLFVREELYARRIAGDRVESEDCSGCQEGHFTSSANATGIGYFSWTTPQPLNLNGLLVNLDYGSDTGGVDVIVSAFNNGGQLRGQVWFKDVMAGGLPGTPSKLMGAFGNGVAGVTRIVLETVTVGGNFNPATDPLYRGGFSGLTNFGNEAISADVNYDNVIPEIDALAGTGALTLLAGALALAGERRRRSD
jgi:hypothetical protein